MGSASLMLSVLLGSVLLMGSAVCHTTLFLIELSLVGSTPPSRRLIAEDWFQNLTNDELTSVGVRQSYNMGKALASKFSSVFNPPPGRDEIFFRAVDTSAGIQAAHARAIGLWDSFPYVTIDFDREDARVRPPWVSFDLQSLRFSTPLPTGFAPISLFTVNKTEEYSLLAFNEYTCPAGYNNFSKIWIQLSDSVSKSQQFRNMISAAEASIGMSTPTANLDYCLSLFSYISAQVQNTNTTSAHLEALRSCRALWATAGLADTQLAKTAGANWATSLSSQLASVLAGTNKQKYAHYSTDDERVLTGLLGAFGFVDPNCVKDRVLAGKTSEGCGILPVSGSSVLFELFKDTDGKHFVNMFFDMQQLIPCQGATSCPVSTFSQLLSQKLDSSLCLDEKKPSPTPHNTETHRKSSTWRLLGIICLSLLCLQLVLTVYCCCHKLSSKSTEEERLDASEYVQVDDVLSKN